MVTDSLRVTTRRPTSTKPPPTTRPPRAGIQGCRLPMCMTGGEAAPRLYVAEHIDGAGHRLKNLFDGLATARRNGMNFGGLLTQGARAVTDHGIDFHKLALDFLGGTPADDDKSVFLGWEKDS